MHVYVLCPKATVSNRTVRKRTVSNRTVRQRIVSNRTVRNFTCLIARCAIAMCPIVLCASEPLPRMTQVLSGHGCFREYLRRIGKEAPARCHHCPKGQREEDSARHTLLECVAWS